MKIKILTGVIILCSLISGLIGSYVFLYYISPELNNIITKTITKEIVKDGTQITINDIQSEVTKLVKKASPSVVSIIVKKDLALYKSDPWGFFQEKVGTVEKQVGGGSGFFISKDGIILTNKHVVSDPNAKYTIITSDSKEYDASVLALDDLNDIAVLKVENLGATFAVLPIIQDNESINIGQFAIAIGNALGEFQNSVSFGVISGKNRSIEAEGMAGQTEKLTGLLQTDTAINPGNSGGPLLDLSGNVVGMNTAIAGNSQGLGFSIPLTQKKINYMLASIKTYGKIKRPFLGINYIPVNDTLVGQLSLKVNYGAFIPTDGMSILKGSNAEKAGLNAGDIILEIDNKKVTAENTIAAIIQNKIPGDMISLKVLKHNSEEKTLDIELGEY